MNKFEESRINAGITVTDLSREANISRSTIDKMEKDEPVKAELAVRACRVLSQHLGYEVTYQSLGMRVIS
jgi:DNA-binding XRE family transcriptional regulator